MKTNKTNETKIFFYKFKIFYFDIISSMGISYQILRHLLVGGIGVIFNFIFFAFFRHFLNFPTIISGILTHFFLFFIIFPFQKYFTYRNYQKKLSQRWNFLIILVTYFCSDISLAYLFIDIMGFSVFVGKILTLAILTPFSFLSQRFWVFDSR